MKYSDATLVTANDLTGTEIISLSIDGVQRSLSLAELKDNINPPDPPTGYGLLVANPQTNTGTRFVDPTGTLPPAVPVTAPTLNSLNATGQNTLVANWQDNQINPSDGFRVFCVNTSTSIPIANYPLDIGAGYSQWTIGGLQPETEYSVSVAARVGLELSAPSNILSETTLAPAAGGFIPVRNSTFSLGTQGQNADDKQGGVLGDGWTFNSDDKVGINYYDATGPSGQMCCAVTARDGDVSFGGGITRKYEGTSYTLFNYVQGDELWVRFFTWIPSGFNYWSQPGFTKWTRWGTNRGASTAGHLDGSVKNGAQDLLMGNSEVWTKSPDRQGDSIYPGWDPQNPYMGAPAQPRDQWVMHEWYVKLHHDATIGKMSYWQDGVLYQDMNMMTLGTATDTCNKFAFCTYWNGDSNNGNPGSPADQTLWMRDLIIADSNSPPPNTINGRTVIGDLIL